MKLGIDISQIVYRGSGVARFTTGLVQAICEHDRKNEWHFFFSSLRNQIPSDVKNAITRRSFTIHEYKIPPTLLSFMWNSLHVVGIEQFTGSLDWLITSDWTEPPSKCKKATIVHDLAYIRYPETFADVIVSTQRMRMKQVKKDSDILFADSESTKQDILHYLQINDKKIVVNYPGVISERNFKPNDSHYKKTKYILTVGKREPRKNLSRLIEAFKSVATDDIKLIVVGDHGWGHTPDKKSENVQFLGYVSDEELADLYSSCLFFVYPSVWEGFGYPVIEAMSYGAPVATSNNSSLGEIAAGNAILFDPQNTEEIASVLTRLMTDKKLRSQLSEKGKKHAAQYTWKRYYEVMMKTLTV